MIEAISSTPETVAPPAPKKDYAIFRDGVLYSMICGTRSNASILVLSLFNQHPSADLEFELAA